MRKHLSSLKTPASREPVPSPPLWGTLSRGERESTYALRRCALASSERMNSNWRRYSVSTPVT